MMKAKRLTKEKIENQVPGRYFYIQPLPDDMQKWHFTFIGPEGTEYEGGIYHGYFDLPHDYPLSPPNIYYLNESGRYEPNKKICLTITSYHASEWTPLWSLRTMMEAANAYFIIDGEGIGSMKSSAEKRKELASKSRNFSCSHCGDVTQFEKVILDARQSSN